MLTASRVPSGERERENIRPFHAGSTGMSCRPVRLVLPGSPVDGEAVGTAGFPKPRPRVGLQVRLPDATPASTSVGGPVTISRLGRTGPLSLCRQRAQRGGGPTRDSARRHRRPSVLDSRVAKSTAAMSDPPLRRQIVRSAARSPGRGSGKAKVPSPRALSGSARTWSDSPFGRTRINRGRCPS